MNNIIFQQGDVILKKCGVKGFFIQEFDDIPAEAKPIKGNLLLKGQTNSHALYGGKFQLLKKGDTVFLNVIKETKLDHVEDHLVKRPKHAEHHAQQIPQGKYFLSPLMEYDHMLEESRQVID